MVGIDRYDEHVSGPITGRRTPYLLWDPSLLATSSAVAPRFDGGGGVDPVTNALYTTSCRVHRPSSPEVSSVVQYCWLETSVKWIPTFSRARERWQAVSMLSFGLYVVGVSKRPISGNRRSVDDDAEMRASVGDLTPRRNPARSDTHRSADWSL